MGLISYQINDNCASAVLPHPAALRFYHKHSDPCNEDAPGSMGVVLFLEIVKRTSSHLCVEMDSSGHLRSTQQRPES